MKDLACQFKDTRKSQKSKTRESYFNVNILSRWQLLNLFKPYFWVKFPVHICYMEEQAYLLEDCRLLFYQLLFLWSQCWMISFCIKIFKTLKNWSNWQSLYIGLKLSSFTILWLETKYLSNKYYYLKTYRNHFCHSICSKSLLSFNNILVQQLSLKLPTLNEKKIAVKCR